MAASQLLGFDPNRKPFAGTRSARTSQVRDPPGVDLVALIAADALILVALEIIRPCRFQCGFDYARMRSESASRNSGQKRSSFQRE